MDKTDSPVETRIDLECIEQQLRTELWEQPGVYPAAEAETALEEQSEGQGEEGTDGDTTSSPSSVQVLVKDRDPKGVNKCLKVMYLTSHCSQ